MRRLVLTLYIILYVLAAAAQISHTANDIVIPYNGFFRPGVNLGQYPPWTETALANIIAGNEDLNVKGVGVKAIRPGLFESFLLPNGYDARIDVFDHFSNVGLKENTCIVGFPDDIHRDTNYYCPDHQSELFANLYEPIWDDGTDGTPINEENYYADYIFKTVSTYKDYIRFWEIWNEPGFDFTGQRGWLPPGSEGNWWENNPDPCDYKLRAPIFHYIRILRISYEVIKTIDANAYVAIAGVGYPSFLDAILRNTDNPVDGSATADYPNGGGAYFDVMGYHSYPHFDGSMRYYDDAIQDFVYTRHSDAAAKGVLARQTEYQSILANHGYDGNSFPKKEWIITECNLPRKAFGNFIGSDEAQRNFIIKAAVTCMENDIHQLHIFKIGEEQNENDASSEFDLMGLYQKLENNAPYTQQVNEEGIAYKTFSDLIFEKEYDVNRTAALQLPTAVKGAAFQDVHGNYSYILWAETSVDNSEAATANYSFPEEMNINKLLRQEWDYSETYEQLPTSTQNIQLTGTPSFFTELLFEVTPLNGCQPLTVNCSALPFDETNSWEWYFENGTPNTSTDQNPIVVFNTSGLQEVMLEIKNSMGNIIAQQSINILVETIPEIDFDYHITGPIVYFSSLTEADGLNYNWDFGDGTSSTEKNPTKVYYNSGNYTIQLVVSNNCGSKTISRSIDITVPTTSQINSTANDQIPDYDGHFKPGVNLEYYPPWSDEQLGDIAAGNQQLGIDGVGAKTLRTILPDYFLENWGFDIRVPTFQHYSNLDLRDNAVAVGFPSLSHQDSIYYCPEKKSALFANMYLDIWDDGTDGTPINDDNYYAAYLYEVVTRYKDYIQFWEIYSSPGYDITADRGWLPPSEPGNWWENNPDPCDLGMHAPVTHYIRMLRISYEIIKNYDPDGFITVSGIGFPSFLDALLRNTDNPADGSVASGYSLKGGAYFDAIGIHAYPHFDGSTSDWDPGIGGFVYRRHSDAAADGILQSKEDFETVLNNYGYDGANFPEKKWIISESNIPRAPFGEYIGSVEAQRNFMLKAYVQSAKNNILQFQVEKLAELEFSGDAQSEFELMGLYKKLEDISPYEQRYNESGIAFKTCSDILYGTTYQVDLTNALALPDGVNGAVFQDAVGQNIYVLWAATQIDKSEDANANYSFPSSFNINQLYKKEWNYFETNEVEQITSQNITLTGTPIFVVENTNTIHPPVAYFESGELVGCPPFTLEFEDQSVNADAWSWNFPGGNPTQSNEQNPIIEYDQVGQFDVRLEVTNMAGSHSYELIDRVHVQDIPEANFSFTSDEHWISFTNASVGATYLKWDFGDDNTATSFSPTHYFYNNGDYEVQLIAGNDCGTDTITQLVSIMLKPSADFNVTIGSGNCDGPFEVYFQDQSAASPTEWLWFFPNANPSSSTEKFPTVNYNTGGTHEVRLIAINELGADTLISEIYIPGNVVEALDDTLCVNDNIVINGTIYNIDNPTGIETLEGVTSSGCDSTVNVNLNFEEILETNISDTIQQGDSYIFGDTSFTSTGIYIDTLSSVNSCDSIVKLDLTVLIVNSVSTIEKPILLSCFPNPFNDRLVIEFELNQSENVTIEIIDIYGRVVASLLEHQEKQTGLHQLIWNAQEAFSGIYFCRLKTKNKIKLAKVVHL